MMTRRKFLGLGALALPAALGADVCIEPTNLRVRQLTLRADGVRFVHFSDFHFKGDGAYADHVVRTINDLQPEFVCFTGDLVENKSFAPDALAFVRQIKAPVYGSPGNHDYWCGAAFSTYEKAFASTGGGWLADRSIVLPKHDLEVVGMGIVGIHALKSPQATRRLLLLHYPKMADSLGGPRFDLIMSGHSHGGQVRLPFYGALVVPWGVGEYDLGYFETKGG
ncbi:MAG: metallophosphoesterase, partial [Chthoniobacterales bacterium]